MIFLKDFNELIQIDISFDNESAEIQFKAWK